MRKLSDGTIAKVGMIVVVLDGEITSGNTTGTITRISHAKSAWKDSVECDEYCDGVLAGPLTMTENYENLRKATPEEELIFNGKK